MPEITTERVMAPVDRILVDGRHVCATDVRTPCHVECRFLAFLIACRIGSTHVRVEMDLETFSMIPHKDCPIAPGVAT